ncbi:MAG: acylphosphatase [Parasphingorhabdus sp.]|jgi:acylphosphatase
MAGKMFLVCGVVQGVGFRWSTLRVARQLELTGYCKNLTDGSVEVCAFGDESAIAQLSAWLQQGPPGADVVRVETFLLDDETPAEFKIR